MKEKILEEIVNHLLINASSQDDIGLYNGKMGISIFIAHYAHYTHNEIYLDFVYSVIEEIYDDLDNSQTFNFDIGLSGIGWGINYLLRNNYLSGEVDEVLSGLDEEIMKYDVCRINDLSFDSGLGGLLYYVISRLQTKRKDVDLPFDLLFLSDLMSAISQKELVCTDLFLKELFLQYKKGYMQNVFFNERLPILPEFLKGKEISLQMDISKMPLGLKSGIAGYGLNLMQL